MLAGYLVKISKKILDEFTVINIHPSLLPKYGGKGFYGMNVHNAVFENKENYSILEIKEKTLPYTFVNKKHLRSIA